MLLIGNGELEDEIKSKISKLNLEKHVKLLGIRKDVNKIYQAMDIFLMPSLFEGLPLTGIEAQASRLKCFFADTITREVIITDNTEFLPLNISAKEWADKIMKNSLYDRKSVKIINQDFNIKNLAKKMQNRYIEYNKRNFEE